MNRREFITLVGAAAAWPLPLSAQQSEGMRHIAVLMGLPEDDPETKARAAKLRQELERLGWSEGHNVRIDTRFAPARAQAQVLSKELVSLRPDVLLAHSAQIAAALQRETRTIPIVFVNVSDPVALLKEIAPDLGRAALVADPKSPVYDYFLRSAKAAAPSLAIALVPAPVENAADIEHFFDTFTRVSNGGLLPPPDIATHFPRGVAGIGCLIS